MIKKYFCFLFLSLSLFHYVDLFSQRNADAGSWNTFNIEKSIKGKFSVLFTQECRLKENFTRLNLFYTNLGVECKFNKYVKAALVYRWIDKFQDDNTFSFRNRLMLDITAKEKFGKFAVAYRHRLQAEKRDMFTSKKGLLLTEWYSRNKVSVKYDLNKPYTPFVAVEMRYQLHDMRRLESENTWHRGRYSFGMEYKFNEKNTFGAYYLIQNEWNVESPNNVYILGLEYTLSL